MGVDRLFEAGIGVAKLPLKVSGWAASIALDKLMVRTEETYANSRFTLNDEQPSISSMPEDRLTVVRDSQPSGSASHKLRAAILVPHEQV